MKYKKHQYVYVSGGPYPGLARVRTTKGMGSHCVVVEGIDSRWLYAFTEDGYEACYSDTKLMPLTKLHKILLGIA